MNSERILDAQRLASYLDDLTGDWLYTIPEIARQLGISEDSVRDAIRQGNRQWHQLARWNQNLWEWVE